MLVRKVVLSSKVARTTTVERFNELFALTDGYERIAFVGSTAAGRAGIAFDLKNGVVTGHKMEPIPDILLDRVKHVPLTDAHEAFACLARGEDILLGDQRHGMLAQWVGTRIEVFGAGEDTQ